MRFRRNPALLATPALVTAVAVLSPAAARAANDFNPAPGAYTVNTTTLTLTGPGTNITGTSVGGVAVFSFGNVSIPSGATITASGSLPLEIVASGTFTLNGTIDGSGASAVEKQPGPYAGGPGGGAGSAEDTASGSGSGGGKPGSTYSDGGGGAGFGGAGAAGGSSAGTGGAGGVAYGDLTKALAAGSGGAGATDSAHGPAVGGGGGGGAIELSATSLTVGSTGKVLANGGDGSSGEFGASGGGSGGAIVLQANVIDVTGTVSAKGGQGGAGGCCGDGGGGGGGRVAYQYATLTAEGSPSVSGGTSGTSGSFGHGDLSPDATGAKGVVTKQQVGTATTLAATSVDNSSATLNGSITTNKQSTKYIFEYGTTTAYGNTVPSSPVSAGSGSAPVTPSAGISGLKAGTTYHFRIVAYALGLTIVGQDLTFTTQAKPSVVTGGARVGTAKSTLSGSVRPGRSRTTYVFQFYSRGHALRRVGRGVAGSGHAAVKVSAVLKGLLPGTTYHYRLVAKNAIGSTHGRWRTFTTRAAAPAFTG